MEQKYDCRLKAIERRMNSSSEWYCCPPPAAVVKTNRNGREEETTANGVKPTNGTKGPRRQGKGGTATIAIPALVPLTVASLSCNLSSTKMALATTQTRRGELGGKWQEDRPLLLRLASLVAPVCLPLFPPPLFAFTNPYPSTPPPGAFLLQSVQRKTSHQPRFTIH